MDDISDQDLARLVGAVVWASAPSLFTVRFASNLLAESPIPFLNGYVDRDQRGRKDWWVAPVGAATTVVVAFPSLLGVLARVLPLQTVLGFTNQTLLICGVAREYGVIDFHQQVDLVTYVLVGRTIDSHVLLDGGTAIAEIVPVRAARGLTGVRDTLGAVLGAARTVVGVRKTLESRPHPSRVFDVIGRLPVVGVAAAYVGEVATLGKIADQSAVRAAARAVVVAPL